MEIVVYDYAVYDSDEREILLYNWHPAATVLSRRLIYTSRTERRSDAVKFETLICRRDTFL